MIYLGYECYVLPGYVKTSAVLAIACVYLLLYVMTDIDASRCDGVVNEGCDNSFRHRVSLYVLAVVLGVLSSFVSFFMFVCMALFCVLLSAVLLIIMRVYDNRKIMLKSVGTGLFVLLITAVISAGAYYLDRLYYFGDPALTASIAYRLAYEKCLSYGIPHFKFRTEELALARDAIHRLGVLDPALVDTNERLVYMSSAHLTPSWHEVYNFFRFEKDNVTRVAFFYLYCFLSYFLIRYGGKKGRRTAVSFIIIEVLMLFVMRQLLILGYFRMYVVQIMPFICFLMPLFSEADYRLPGTEDRKKTVMMLAADVVLVAYLAFSLFGDGFPVRWSSNPISHETNILYEESDTADTDDGSGGANGEDGSLLTNNS